MGVMGGGLVNLSWLATGGNPPAFRGSEVPFAGPQPNPADPGASIPVSDQQRNINQLRALERAIERARGTPGGPSVQSTIDALNQLNRRVSPGGAGQPGAGSIPVAQPVGAAAINFKGGSVAPSIAAPTATIVAPVAQIVAPTAQVVLAAEPVAQASPLGGLAASVGAGFLRGGLVGAGVATAVAGIRANVELRSGSPPIPAIVESIERGAARAGLVVNAQGRLVPAGEDASAVSLITVFASHSQDAPGVE